MKRPIPHKFINNTEYKQCSKCQEYKLLNNFANANNTQDMLYPSCKICKKLVKNYVLKKAPDKLINEVMSRLCSTCNCWKDKVLFVPNERQCLECKNLQNIKYYNENKEELNKASSQYYQEHKDAITSNHKIWVENNKEYLAEYGREYREIHQDELRIYDRNKHHKYKHNINYRITKNMRRRVLDAIKGNPKQSTTFKLVGCSIEELKFHLKKLFLPNMNWDNYGQWHIDHIIPCSSFDLSDLNEQKKCFHYTNLQPLWAKDNLKKGTKLS